MYIFEKMNAWFVVRYFFGKSKSTDFNLIQGVFSSRSGWINDNGSIIEIWIHFVNNETHYLKNNMIKNVNDIIRIAYK